MFYTEIQDGWQKWWENGFCPKVVAYSAYTLAAKNSARIALSRNISEILKTFYFHC